MKPHAIVMFAAAIATTAAWGQSASRLQPIYAIASPGTECAPPNDHMGHACDAFNGMIRANFTPREIAVLFGPRTTHSEYVAGGVDALQKRYQAVVQQYDLAQQQARAAQIASQ